MAVANLDCDRRGCRFVAIDDRGRRRQRSRRRKLVACLERGALEVGRQRRPRQRVEGEPQTHRRVAGDEVEATAPQIPRRRAPAVAIGRGMEWQDESGRVGNRSAEPFDQPDPCVGFVDAVGLLRVEISDRRISAGEASLTPRLIDRILVCGDDPVLIEPEPRRDGVCEPPCVLAVGTARLQRRGEQIATLPQGLAVGAPHDAELPPRERFARIPLALTVLDQSTVGESVVHSHGQFVGQHTFGVAVGFGVPLGSLHVVDRDEGGLAAHGQPDVTLGEASIDGLADLVDAPPLFGRVRQGHPGVLADPVDHVRELELNLGRGGASGDRGGGRRVRRARQRDVALPGEQPGGRVEAHPAGTGDEDLCPRVEIGEVGVGPVGATERRLVGCQLHQVSGHEACGESEPAQCVDEQPAGVATRSDTAGEGVLGRLHPGFHSDRIGDVVVETAVQPDEEVGDRGVDIACPKSGQPPLQSRTDGTVRSQVGLEILGEVGLVRERECLRRFLDEEVERVDDGEVGHEVDGDVEKIGRLGKHQAGHEVAERILLPVDEVFTRRDAKAVRQNRCSAVRGRPQPHHMRMDLHGSIEAVRRAVLDADMNAHRHVLWISSADQGPSVIGGEWPDATGHRVPPGTTCGRRPEPERRGVDGQRQQLPTTHVATGHRNRGIARPSVPRPPAHRRDTRSCYRGAASGRDGEDGSLDPSRGVAVSAPRRRPRRRSRPRDGLKRPGVGDCLFS